MEQKDLQQLIQIYNTMLLISTSGLDTIKMADCLKALKQVILDNSEGKVTEEA